MKRGMKRGMEKGMEKGMKKGRHPATFLFQWYVCVTVDYLRLVFLP